MRDFLGKAVALALFLCFLAFPALVSAQEAGSQAPAQAPTPAPAPEPAIRDVQILSLEGTVSIKRTGSAEWISAAMGDLLMPGDALRTGPMSSVELNFDGTGQAAVVRVSENAELMFSKLSWDRITNVKETLLDLAIGSVLIKASKLEAESKFEVNTPTSIVGVRGTTFEVRVSAGE